MTRTDVAPVVAPAPAHRAPVRRLADRAQTTPGRLSVIVVVLIVLGLASGLTGWLALRQRAELVHDMTVRTSPLGVSALDIYRSLSDADSTAASAFLTGGIEPPQLRARYLDNIARASEAMTVASANAATGSVAAAELKVLGAHLPVYTGLIETARAINRQGFTLGAAYLREASGLMRYTLLPAAQRLYDSEKVRLADAQNEAAAFPWLPVILAGLTLVALVAAQVYLTRRTNRVFNVGLALATLATLVCLSWIGVATISMANHLDTGRRSGSAQVQLLAEARIAALQARTQEALALVARGSGQEFENGFKAASEQLDALLAQARDAAPDAASRDAQDAVRNDVRTWMNLHAELRKLDDGGRYPDAVRLAIGSGEHDLPAVFMRIDTALTKGVETSSVRFGGEAAAAQSRLAGSDVAVAAFTLLLVCGAAVGIQQRITEYR